MDGDFYDYDLRLVVHIPTDTVHVLSRDGGGWLVLACGELPSGHEEKGHRPAQDTDLPIKAERLCPLCFGLEASVK